MTMKKDGIQTRNRKVSTKTKRCRRNGENYLDGMMTSSLGNMTSSLGDMTPSLGNIYDKSSHLSHRQFAAAFHGFPSSATGGGFVSANRISNSSINNSAIYRHSLPPSMSMYGGVPSGSHHLSGEPFMLSSGAQMSFASNTGDDGYQMVGVSGRNGLLPASVSTGSAGVGMYLTGRSGAPFAA